MVLETLPLLLPVFLYAETHYKFRYFFSWLRKKEPEIVVDAPRFVEPGRPVPVLVIVKDAHQYPVTLRSITLNVRQGLEVILTREFLEGDTPVSDRLWWRVYHLALAGRTGWVDIDPKVKYQCNASNRSCGVDNYKGSSQLPLNVYLAQKALPRQGELHYGDCHTHSSYTDDQVEFGSPLGASVALSKASGLSYFCATDHSYDLDDSPESFLVNDPALPKWNAFQAEVEELNLEQRGHFAVVAGEEISCRSASGANVHMVLLGDRAFYEGSGDSAEKWLSTRSEHRITDLLQAKSRNALAFAAHPREPVPRLQQLLLGRGEWSQTDLDSGGLDGIQFINGRLSRSFEWGLQEWVRLLLKGKHTVALAGTDAHGNFNRFRQQGIPFLTIKEHHHQLFGQIRTAVLLDGDLSEEHVLHALKSGASVLTDGPICTLRAANDSGELARIGHTIQGDRIRLELSATSTLDFGAIDSVSILHGTVDHLGEVPILSEVSLGKMHLNLDISFDVRRPGYVRATVHTSAENPFSGTAHICLTNPIWIEPTRR